MMKNIVKKVVAIILAIAAIMSFAACSKKDTATDDVAQTTTPTTAVAAETSKVEEDIYVDIDLYQFNEDLQKQLLELLPEDGEIQISKDVSVERWHSAFYVEAPYSHEYLGSTDVPFEEGGWGWSGETYCYRLENGGTIKLSEDNKQIIECWDNQQIIWTVDIGTELASIDQVWGDVIVLSEKRYDSDHAVYIVYDQKVRKLGEDVLEIDPSYGDLWWLTIDGRVYFLEAYHRNPEKEAKLMAENAIALSNNTSDGPGWYIAGEADYRDDWSPVVGEFVPVP